MRRLPARPRPVPDRRGHRVGVGLHPARCPALVHVREAHLLQVEPLRGQRQQVRPLDQHGLADRLLPRVDHARFIGAAAGQQLRIQRLEVARVRHRHPVIPPELPDLVLDAALLVPLAGRAELRVEPPVRAKRHEPHRLLPPIPAQHLAHRAGQIVVAQRREDATEVRETPLRAPRETPAASRAVGPVERRAAGHAAQAEHLQRHPLVAKDRHGFVPVDLRLAAPRCSSAARDGLAREQPLGLPSTLARTRRTVDAAIGRRGPLRLQPSVDPPRRVPLFPRRRPVRLQDRDR